MKKTLIAISLLGILGLNAEVMKITLPLETVTFKNAPGVQLANGQCLTCHSADYALTQPPKGLDFWAAEVKKMKDKYGAPIPDDQIAELAAYFAANYGTGATVPTPAVTAPEATIDPETLARRSGCLGCHSVNTKIIGPAYKDVAAKYRGRADAMEKVEHQITHGGGGQWGGPIPMPPFPQFTPKEVDALAQWVLSQK